MILQLTSWLTHDDRAACDVMSCDRASFHTQQVPPAASPASARQTVSQPQPASAVRPAELGKGLPSGPARQAQGRPPACPSPAERRRLVASRRWKTRAAGGLEERKV